MNGNSNPTLLRAIRGPIMMITVGVLFALDHMTEFTFGRTWPAILIVLGVLVFIVRQRVAPLPPPVAIGGEV